MTFDAPPRLQIQSPYPELDSQYSEEYYRCHCGHIPYERSSHWLSFFAGIADQIILGLRPRRVFDAGCAWGFLVEAFWDRGIDARGIDISNYAIKQVRPDLRERCTIGSVSDPIRNGRYDLVICIEVLEHVDESVGRAAIDQMTQVTDAILFSSTPDDFNEPTHVNVRSVIYWLRLFQELGFYPDPSFDASFISPHAFLVRRLQTAMPEELLLAFNEAIRNRVYRAAFLTRQERLENLERDVRSLSERAAAEVRNSDRLRSQIHDLQSALTAAHQRASQAEEGRGQIETAKRSIEDSLLLLNNQAAQNVTILRDLERKNKESAALLDSANAELERRISQYRQESSARQSAEVRANTLTREIEQSHDHTIQLQKQLDEWMVHTGHLADSMELLSRRYRDSRAELESVISSPAWRFILNYREWLRRNRWKHAWIRKGFDPLVRWMLTRLSGTDPNAVTSQVPVKIATPHAVSTVASTDQPLSVLPLPKQGASTEGVRFRYEDWIRETEPGAVGLSIQRSMANCLEYRPKISLLVPIHTLPLDVLKEMLQSVMEQTYDNWELCATIVPNENLEAIAYLKHAADSDPRIHVKGLDKNWGISGNSNQALSIATGEFLALLDHDDTLAPFALFEVVQALNQDRNIGFLYSDKDQITADGTQRVNPLFKPEWSPEIMLNANYLTHLCVMRADAVREVGGWRPETDGAQDWDLFLRVIAKSGSVRHIPKVLYHWRQLSTSVAAGGLGSKPYAVAGQIRTVTDYCKTLNLDVHVTHTVETGLHVCWPLQAETLVSVILISSAPIQEAMAAATQLKQRTQHPNFEILVPAPAPVDGAPTAREEDARVVSVRDGATLAERAHAAVQAANGAILVFIDQCVTPADPDWLQELIGPLQIPNVALAGSRLVNSNTGMLRHCGLVFTSEGSLHRIHSEEPEHIYEQFAGALWYRNWTAVSGACFAIYRKAWKSVDGVSGDLMYPRLDVHLCLKLTLFTMARIAYNPYARLFQDGEASFETLMGPESADVKTRMRRYFPRGDPHFNPNLDCDRSKVVFRRRDHADPQPSADYPAESRLLLDIFDAEPATIARSRQIHEGARTGQFQSVTWFLPEFSHVFYGGVHTILRFADGFLRRHGVHSNFCILGQTTESAVRRAVTCAFPALAESSFSVIDNHKRANELPPSDAAICSLWTTAYAALEFNRTRRKLYFMQDDEALFYPASSTSALVEATYRFGFHGICNTASLLRRYQACGGSGEYFIPCVDRSLFFPSPPSQSRKEPHMVFCYGRPGHPRNCFELLTATMRILKQRMGNDVSLVTAGADWDVRDYGLDGIVHNLGLLPYPTTGALYRACTAGVVLMMTRHPSYLPLELMACGSLVITNRNPDTAWLLRDEENCLLADPSPSCIAERIEKGLRDCALRETIVTKANTIVNSDFGHWEYSIDRIYSYIQNLC